MGCQCETKKPHKIEEKPQQRNVDYSFVDDVFSCCISQVADCGFYRSKLLPVQRKRCEICTGLTIKRWCL